MTNFLDIARSNMERAEARREMERNFAALRIPVTDSARPPAPTMTANGRRKGNNKGGVKDPICFCGVRKSVHDVSGGADYCDDFRRAYYQPDARRPMAVEDRALRTEFNWDFPEC